MAFGKLTQGEAKEFEELRGAVEAALDKAKAFVEQKREIADEGAWNTLLVEADELFGSLAGAIDDAGSWASDFASNQQDQYDDKSEKWQESDRASAVSDFISNWENVADQSMSFEVDGGQKPEAFPATLDLTDAVDLSDAEYYLDELNSIDMEASY